MQPYQNYTVSNNKVPERTFGPAPERDDVDYFELDDDIIMKPPVYHS